MNTASLPALRFFRAARGALLVCALTACSGSRAEPLAVVECTSERDCMGSPCLEGECQETPAVTEIEVSASAAAEGAPVVVESTVEGGGRCAESRCTLNRGATVTFRAPHEPGYRFVAWRGDPLCLGTEPELVLSNVSADIACLAQYVRRVTVRGVTADGRGAIEAQAEDAAARCSGDVCEVDRGQVVVLRAPAREGARFVAFEGEGCTPFEPNSVRVSTADADVSCVARYQPTATLQVKVEGADASAVSLRSEQPSAVCSLASCTVDVGASVTLRAAPVPSSRFAGFHGDPACRSDEPTFTVRDLQQPLTCIASYRPRQRVEGLAQGAEPVPTLLASSADTHASCQGAACEVDRGGSVTLLAPSVDGYRLRGWLGDACAEQTGAAVTLSPVERDLTCTADYVRGVSVTGAVIGAQVAVTASSDAPTASCLGAGCRIDAGATVTLRVANAEGFSFAGWSGDAGCSGSTPSITLRDVTSSKTCVARFTRLRFEVTASVAPAASGTVVASSASPTASCLDARCTVDHGASVTLRASPLPGYDFAGWSGCASDGNPLLELANVTRALACEARFSRRRVTVRAAVSGSGAVALSSGDPSASCSPESCSVDYEGSVVLTGSVRGSARFVGWSGCSSATTPTLTLANLRENQSCTANFVARVNVSAGVFPANNGTVTLRSSSPSASCSVMTCLVDVGSSVTLTANPATGFEFTNWSDCSLATTRTLTLTELTASRFCRANVRLRNLVVTVVTNPPSVTRRYNVLYGTLVIPEPPPTPAGRDYFSSWSNCPTGYVLTREITLSDVRSELTCTANYANVE